MRRIHFISGLIITIFVGPHLLNHVLSIYGADKHMEIMDLFRHLYRNIFVESILLIAVLFQIISGLTLFKTNRRTASAGFDKLHIWTGLYLALFLVIHLGAVLGGRYILHLDTNFYFGVAGINTFPFNIFFIPYYGLAILSFFAHIASIHYKKMNTTILNLRPKQQAKGILIFGFFITFIIFYGLTNQFKGVEIPKEYHILIGK